MLHLKFHALIRFIIGFIYLSFFLTGCTYRFAFGDCQHRVRTGECYQTLSVNDNNLLQANYIAADNLLQRAVYRLKPTDRFLVTTIADINALDTSTPFGRLLGEQLGARLVQQGYPVIEMKFHRRPFVIPRTGEFILSRELLEFSND